MKTSPILLFAYNRPHHIERTVRALQKNEMAGESTLIVHSDGPKGAHDEEKVQKVRDYIKTIGGFKDVMVTESPINIGLADSIIEGVTGALGKYESVVVLEDDLVTSPGFLRFMNEALEFYSGEKKVMQISGHMFDVKVETETDAIFMPFTTSWGWATWKRAWDHFDPLMSGYEKLRKKRSLRHRFNLEGAYNYFDMLRAEKRGKIDSWAIRWYLSVFMMGGLTLYPVRTFIDNIGLDGSGTHRGRSLRGPLPLGTEPRRARPARYPEVSLRQGEYDQVKDYLYSLRSYRERLRSALSGIRPWRMY